MGSKSGGETTEPGRFEALRRWAFGALALLAVAGAILRAAGVGTVDREAVYFLIVAGVLLALERIRKFSFGKDGIVFEAVEGLRAEVAATRKVAEENQRVVSLGVGGKRRDARAASTPGAKALKLPAPTVPDDPQKGRFGGLATRNGRRLSARVEPAQGYPGNYDVRLEVASTDATKPLGGRVTFYLHDSFTRSVEHVQAVEGVATLELLAYGAFTVGVVVDDGDTLLELDLSEDPKFPKRFREN